MKHVEQFPDKIKCVALHLVGYILEYKIMRIYGQTIAAGSSNGVTNIRCCRYSCMCS
jgi:hypothetical protein